MTTTILNRGEERRRLLQLMGEELREARKSRGWTIDYLSYKSGVGESSISQLENGKVSRPECITVRKITRWLRNQDEIDKYIDAIVRLE